MTPPTYDNLRRTLRGGSWYYYVTLEAVARQRRFAVASAGAKTFGFRTALAGRFNRQSGIEGS